MISGRMGNQFFRYAFTRYILEKRKNVDSLVFDYYWVEKQNFEDVLHFFNIVNFIRTNKNTFFLMRGQQMFWYIKSFIKRKWCTFINKPYVFDKRYQKKGLLISYDGTCQEEMPIPYKAKNIVICGNFENPKYFEEIKPILLKEFTPKFPPLEHNKKLYEIINNTNSVCVTIRRGDYLSTNNKNVYYLCDEAYFQKAIQLIATKVNNPVFIFFSDDIEWVKNNIKVKFEAYYERGDDPIWEKIRLMYSCKHFIISNSSFSWWAQYLSRNEQKVVVSPNRWYRKGCVTTLIDEKFLTIEV